MVHPDGKTALIKTSEGPPVLFCVSLAQRPVSADLNLDLHLWQGL